MNRLIIFMLTLLGVIALPYEKTWAASGVTADVAGLNFPDQAEGTVSPPQTVTLTNGGGDGVIWSLILGGKDPGQFFIMQDNCSATVLAIGASCTVQVVYRPDENLPDGVGPAQAVLLVPFNDPPSLSIALSGNSVIPEIDCDFSVLDFGEGVIGSLGSSQTVTVTNDGSAALVLEDTKIVGQNSADFGLTTDLCSFQSLAPSEICQVTVSMRPTGVGTRSGTLIIKNNDTDEPFFAIQLTGSGKGSGGCSLNPSLPNFAEQGGWLILFALFFRFRVGKRINLPSLDGRGSRGG